MFYPEPLTLAYSEHLIVSVLTAMPVFWLGGNALMAHNLVFLFSFALAGLGAYMLAFELTGSRPASLVAGLAFAFAPIRFGHLGHLQILTTQYMPFVLLYLHRLAQRPLWRYALCLAFFWVLQILSCGYHGMYISLAVGLFILFFGWLGRWWKQPGRLIQLGAVFLGLVIVVGPFFLSLHRGEKDQGVCAHHRTGRKLRRGSQALPGRSAGQQSLRTGHGQVPRRRGRAFSSPCR